MEFTTWPDDFFSKLVCKFGGWGNKQWGKHSIRPAIVVFLQRGAGAKKIFFAIFFCGTHFCEGHKAKN